jgi:hypothetical protein
MPRIASAPPEPAEIEITAEMVSAAAEVLWRDPFAQISESVAEEMARKMLALALALSKPRKRTDVGGRVRLQWPEGAPLDH